MTREIDDIILGGGLAGLTAADALLDAGRTVAVIEREGEVGGLARNVIIDGNTFDIGGHRFFTENTATERWLTDLMGDELIRVQRLSHILLNGRFAHYPLKPINALMGLGLANSMKVAAGYLAARLGPKGPQDNFEQWVVARFGRPLYDIYFGPYTRKAWGCDPRLISSDWARQRIQLPSLPHAVFKALMKWGPTPKTYAQSFLYPKNGIGRIALRLKERIEGKGGAIQTGQPAAALTTTPDGRHLVETSGGEGYLAERVISTISLTSLASLLGEMSHESGLRYRGLRCVFLLLDRDRVTRDTWIYVHDPKVIFARMHEPKNWSLEMVSGSGTSLCLEIFCDEGDNLWNMPDEEIHQRCVSDLARLGLVRAAEVRRAANIRVREAYPVFQVGYKAVLDELVGRIKLHKGIHLLGRTGAFAYENMDQVIESALALVAQLAREG